MVTAEFAARLRHSLLLHSITMAFGQNDDVFLAVYLSPTSQYIERPGELQARHAMIKPKGKVGELVDVQLVSVSRADWTSSQQEIMSALKGTPGVAKVEVQQAKQRTKRVMDEY